MENVENLNANNTQSLMSERKQIEMELKSILEKIQSENLDIKKSNNSDKKLMRINELILYLRENFLIEYQKQTIYQMVCENRIPFKKVSKFLLFDKDEINNHFSPL